MGNLVADDVPVSKDEKDNQEMRSFIVEEEGLKESERTYSDIME